MIQAFASTDEMFDSLEKDRDVADSHIKDWQRTLAPGDYFLRMGPDNVRIYGEILDPSHPTNAGDAKDADHLEALKEEALFYQEEHMQGFRFHRAFSVYCTHGELGDVHISEVRSKISKKEFEAARSAGWV